MRLFTAIELSDDVRAALVQWQNTLRRSVRYRVTWTRPENLHVTMKFIGEVDAARLMQLDSTLKSIVARRDPVRIVSDGLILLPLRGPTRIIAASLRDPSEALENLFADIEGALQPCGIGSEGRRFRPHVTLGRVRDRVRLDPRQIDLEKSAKFEISPTKFALIQSLQLQEGSKYIVLARYPIIAHTSGH